jgi:hypothetical protein
MRVTTKIKAGEDPPPPPKTKFKAGKLLKEIL